MNPSGVCVCVCVCVCVRACVRACGDIPPSLSARHEDYQQKEISTPLEVEGRGQCYTHRHLSMFPQSIDVVGQSSLQL